MKKKTDRAAKVAAYSRAKEAGKRGYQRADRILGELAAEMTPGEEIVLNEQGRKAVLVDKFDGKNIVWNPCAARRWELEVVEP